MRRARIAWLWGSILLVAVFGMFAPSAARASGNAITGFHLDGSAVGGVAFPFTVEATVANPLGAYLSIAVEPAGSGCPQLPTGFYKNSVEATSFPLKEEGPALARGSYVLCAWLSSPENAEIVYDHAALPFGVGDGGSVGLSFSPTPVDGVWLTITATGTSTTSAHLFATYKPAVPGAACGATPQSDAGTGISFAFGGTDDLGGVAAGSYSVAARGVTLALGSYLFCTWLIDAGERLLTSSSQLMNVGGFHGSISLPPPFTITSAGQAKVPVSFTLNAPRRLFVTMQRSGTACAPTFSGSTGGTVFAYPDYEQIGRVDRIVPGTSISEPELEPTGTFSADVRANVSDLFSGQLIPGAYRVCAWLAADDAGADTDYGPVATTVTIPGGSSSRSAEFPYVQGYEYRFDAAHTLRLKVWLSGKATLAVTVYRGAGPHKRRLATIEVAAKRGLNRITIRRVRGRRLAGGRYTFSLYARVGHHRSPTRSFVVTL